LFFLRVKFFVKVKIAIAEIVGVDLDQAVLGLKITKTQKLPLKWYFNNYLSVCFFLYLFASTEVCNLMVVQVAIWW